MTMSLQSLCHFSVHVLTLIELRTPRGVLLTGRKLEDDIGYERFMLSTYAKKAKPVVIAASMDPVFDHWTIHCNIIPHSGVEVTEDDQFAS